MHSESMRKRVQGEKWETSFDGSTSLSAWMWHNSQERHDIENCFCIWHPGLRGKRLSKIPNQMLCLDRRENFWLGSHELLQRKLKNCLMYFIFIKSPFCFLYALFSILFTALIETLFYCFYLQYFLNFLFFSSFSVSELEQGLQVIASAFQFQ